MHIYDNPVHKKLHDHEMKPLLKRLLVVDISGRTCVERSVRKMQETDLVFVQMFQMLFILQLKMFQFLDREKWQTRHPVKLAKKMQWQLQAAQMFSKQV